MPDRRVAGTHLSCILLCNVFPFCYLHMYASAYFFTKFIPSGERDANIYLSLQQRLFFCTKCGSFSFCSLQKFVISRKTPALYFISNSQRDKYYHKLETKVYIIRIIHLYFIEILQQKLYLQNFHLRILLIRIPLAVWHINIIN